MIRVGRHDFEGPRGPDIPRRFGRPRRGVLAVLGPDDSVASVEASDDLAAAAAGHERVAVYYTDVYWHDSPEQARAGAERLAEVVRADLSSPDAPQRPPVAVPWARPAPVR